MVEAVLLYLSVNFVAKEKRETEQEQHPEPDWNIHEFTTTIKSPSMEEEDKVCSLFPCKDNQDWMLDQSSELIIAATLLSSVPYPEQFGEISTAPRACPQRIACRIQQSLQRYPL